MRWPMPKKHGCDMETAALRVFSNADGAYGSNVNNLVESGAWDDEDELAETYQQRKCFAYGASGKPVQQPALLKSMLAMSISPTRTWTRSSSASPPSTTISIRSAASAAPRPAPERRRHDGEVPVYIGDQTRGEGKVRTLSEQVALETRTRMLNPAGTRACCEHGYEGVRQIEAHVTNTMGWSATTGQVSPGSTAAHRRPCARSDAMRERLAELNPTASAMKVANRLIEAHERNYWNPDATMCSMRCAMPAKNSKIGSKGCHPPRPAADRGPTAKQSAWRSQNDIVTPPPTGTKTTLLDRCRLKVSAKGRTAKAASRSRWTRPCRSTPPRSSPSTARAASANRPPRPTCRSPFPSSASACCRSAATPSTTPPSR
jgi:cobalamin biosynthesis Mg chelatase CobN